MAFTLGAYSLSGNPLGLLEFAELKLRRPLSNGLELSFRTWLDVVGQRLEASTTQVRFFEDELARFAGVVAPPLEKTPEGVKVNVLGPLAAMKRQRQTTPYLPAASPLNVIVNDLLTQENNRSPTHLKLGTVTGTLSTLTAYQLLPGAEIAEELVRLATTDPGFYFTEEPDFAPAGNWTRLDLRAPASSGDDLSDSVRFEYGQGTRDSIATYTLAETAIVNAVTVRGAAASEGGEPQVVRVQDAASIALNGLREVHVELSDAGLGTQFMTAMANAQLKPEPVQTLTFTPQTGADVPRFLREFDVGDTVGVVIRDGATNVESAARIVEGALLVSDTSTEASQELIVEST